MAYIDIATLQTIAAGQPLSAATVSQIRDDFEFLIDPPACSVFHNTTQSMATGITLTAVSANSENYDNDSMHSTASLTSRITIQTPGRYEIGVVLSWATNVNGNRATSIRANGTTDHVVDLRNPPSGNSSNLSGSRTLSLAAGDYIEIFVWQNSGGALALSLIEFYAIFRTR